MIITINQLSITINQLSLENGEQSRHLHFVVAELAQVALVSPREDHTTFLETTSSVPLSVPPSLEVPAELRPMRLRRDPPPSPIVAPRHKFAVSFICRCFFGTSYSLPFPFVPPRIAGAYDIPPAQQNWSPVSSQYL